VHAENSSSPNGNTYITGIKTGASGETVQIRLSDGSSFFIHPEKYAELGLYRDCPVDHDLKEKLQEAATLHSAMRKALQLSARRDHSLYEMRLKLRQREYPEHIISVVLDKLHGLGICDDRRFAELWLQSRMRKKNEGPVKIKAELAKRGVDAGIVEELLQDMLGPEQVEEALERATETVLKRCRGDQDRFVRMLQNRGFSWTLIKKHSIGKFIEYYKDLR